VYGAVQLAKEERENTRLKEKPLHARLEDEYVRCLHPDVFVLTDFYPVLLVTDDDGGRSTTNAAAATDPRPGRLHLDFTLCSF
jgi:hypothetical protein